MPMQDQYNDTQAEKSLDLTAITADGDTICANHDRLGFLGLLFLVTCETNTLDGLLNFGVEVSDDGVSWAAAPADFVLALSDVDAAASAGNVLRVGYQGVARYARLKITASGVTVGAANVSVTALKTDAQDAPPVNP